MTLKPIGDHVAIQPLEAEEMTPGGIVLPEMAKEEQRRGRVIAVGPGKWLDSGERCAMQVEVGQEVLFDPRTAHDLEVDGQRVLIVREGFVLAAVG